MSKLPGPSCLDPFQTFCSASPALPLRSFSHALPGEPAIHIGCGFSGFRIKDFVRFGSYKVQYEFMDSASSLSRAEQIVARPSFPLHARPPSPGSRIS